MLTIRDSQYETLDAQAVDDFLKRACVFLRKHLADDVRRVDDDRLIAFARVSYESAKAHRVTGEQGLLRWMCLRIIAGSRFYEMPEIAELLENAASGDLALRQLFDRLAVLETRARGLV